VSGEVMHGLLQRAGRTVIRARQHRTSEGDEPFTPFHESGNLRDLSALGFQPVGAISDGEPTIIDTDALVYDISQWPTGTILSGIIRHGPAAANPPPSTGPVDIVDRIDELVNDQLANYDNRSGYDHNINEQACPHCGREWHGLKITARIESMRITRCYDEGYRYADDDSEVLCEGSEFIGPMKYPSAALVNSAIDGITGTLFGGLLGVLGVPINTLPPSDACQAISRAVEAGQIAAAPLGLGFVGGWPYLITGHEDADTE
jgi:hypothetical protein